MTIREIPKLGMRVTRLVRRVPRRRLRARTTCSASPARPGTCCCRRSTTSGSCSSAFCVGIMDGVLEDALRYVKEREAFGRTIGAFQAIQHHIANIAMWQTQAELIVYRAAWLQDAGGPAGMEANMAKVIASEYAGKPPTSAADPRRHGLLGRDRHAALLARRPALPHRPDHQRDGPQRRSPRPSAFLGPSERQPHSDGRGTRSLIGSPSSPAPGGASGERSPFAWPPVGRGSSSRTWTTMRPRRSSVRSRHPAGGGCRWRIGRRVRGRRTRWSRSPKSSTAASTCW